MDFNINSLLNRYITNIKVEFIYCVIILYVINPLGIGTIIPMLLIPYTFINSLGLIKNRELMINSLILFIFLLSYSILGLHYEFFPIRRLLQSFLNPILFFFLGYLIIDKQTSYEKRLKVFNNSLFSFALAFGSFATLSFLRTIYTFGSVAQAQEELGGRIILGLWNELIPATLFAAYTSLAIVMIPLYFLKSRIIFFDSTIKLNSHYFKKVYQRFKEQFTMGEEQFSQRTKTYFIILKKILLSVMFLIALYSSVKMGSRTIILMIFISVIINLFVFEKKKILKNLFILSAILLVAFFTAYYFNIGNFGLWVNSFSIYSTFLPERLIATIFQGDSRMSMWRQVLHGMLVFPFGGRMTEIPFEFAHNLWLDVGWDVGIIPFILLILFMILVLIKTVKVFYYYNNTFQRAVIGQVLAILLIIFLFEPVLQVVPIFFVLFCFFSGMIFKFDNNYQGRGELEEKYDDNLIHNSNI